MKPSKKLQKAFHELLHRRSLVAALRRENGSVSFTEEDLQRVTSRLYLDELEKKQEGADKGRKEKPGLSDEERQRRHTAWLNKGDASDETVAKRFGITREAFMRSIKPLREKS